MDIGLKQKEKDEIGHKWDGQNDKWTGIKESSVVKI